MQRCKHCGSSFWFSIGDCRSRRTTRDGVMCITSFWRCPACGQYNTLAGFAGFEPKEIADGYALPATTRILYLDEGAAADIEERLAALWTQHG